MKKYNELKETLLVYNGVDADFIIQTWLNEVGPVYTTKPIEWEKDHEKDNCYLGIVPDDDYEFAYCIDVMGHEAKPNVLLGDIFGEEKWFNSIEDARQAAADQWREVAEKILTRVEVK